MEPRDVRYFESPAAFRRWLAENHASATEVWVGFHRKATGRASMTWAESVDQALCYGWIDGIRKRIDDERYAIRFTPRRPGSTWSAVNIRRMDELISLGLVEQPGLEAFARRTEERSRQYSYESAPGELTPEFEERLRANEAAWEDWQRRPPGYRRTAAFWVMSAKKPETRERRLEILVGSCEQGLPIPPMRYGRS